MDGRGLRHRIHPEPGYEAPPPRLTRLGTNGEGLAGIAPALIVTAEYDRLRDEADAYGRKLDAVGSLTEYLEVPAVDHGYNIMSAAPDAADVTRRMYARIAEHVARATSSGQP